MAAPATSMEFLELVRKSGVQEDKRLDAYVQKLRAAGTLPDEPAKLAGLLVRDGLLTHFQAEQILQGKWRRFTLGKYKVLERLGSGGMAHVYLCEHMLMRRRVAVKVLPTAKASDESSLQRFYREARAAAALDHPNIVHAYDIDQDDNLHFLVMEYVDGASLQDVVKKSGPLDPARAANYIRQAALGLEHAHRQGLVHRDIKPGNLLLDRNGTVKILDMGLARFFHDEDDILTRKFEESVLGTADYLAPEQAVDSHTVDIRADIYSLGATFYYLLTGKTPFEGGSVAQKLIWHQTRQARPINTIRSDVPAGLQAVLEKMMAKDREQRYQTPQEVADALAPWVQQPVSPPSEAEMPRLSAAVSGTAPTAEATVVTAPAGPTSPLPRRAWQVSAPATPPKTPSVSRPAPAPPSPSPTAGGGIILSPPPSVGEGKDGGPAAAAMIVPPAAPMPPPAEEAPPWEGLAPETGDLVGQADTDAASVRGLTPPTSRSARRVGRQPAPGRGRTRWVVFGIGGAFFLLLTIFLIVYFLKKPPPPPPVPPRQPLLVTREPGHSRAFATVRRALFHAQPGDVIEILDERIEETLAVAPSQGKTEVTLQAAPGKKIVWTFPKGKEKGPLLLLSHAKGFHLKGQGIILDGQDKLPQLVELTGDCAGLTIEGLELRGFTKMAIRIINCEGTPKNPVRLLDLRTTTVPKEPPAAAIYFELRKDFFNKVNDFIYIGQGNFAGLQPAQAIQRQKEAAIGKYVKW
jgi:serine/threonine protein kinase